MHRFETEPAVVRMQYGVTMNLGNYESVRIDVGISVPCYKEQIEETAEWAKAWVEKRVLAEVQEVQAGRKKNLF